MNYLKKSPMVGLIAMGVLLASQSAMSRNQPPAVERLLQGGDAVVVRGERNGPVVTAGKRFGGSIVSLEYRGVDYVNNEAGDHEVDYGRQLQSAAIYRDADECFNPTEAGGRYDKGKSASSSKLLNYSTPDEHTLVTETDMAFWMGPGEKKNQDHVNCTALNSSTRAGYRLKRTLRVGVAGYQNAIQYDTQYFTPVPETKARYAPIVIHTPRNFTRVYRLEPDRSPTEVTSPNERSGKPFIQATADLGHAVTVCNSNPQNEHFYGMKRFGNTITNRYLEFSDKESTESRLFKNYVVVGTLDEVVASAKKLCFGGQ